MATGYAAYERGYRAAVADKPRKVPGSVRNILPSVSPEWFRGYDDATSDNDADRARVLSEFKA